MESTALVPIDSPYFDRIDYPIVEAALADLASLELTRRARVRDPWPASVRTLAYEVWGWLADRNSKRTAEILAEAVPALSGLSHKTVWQWCHDEGWEARFDQELTNLAPLIHAAVQRQLMLASQDAAATLHEAIRGNLAGDGREVANRITACRDILDRTGHPRMTEVTSMNVRVTTGQKWTVEQLARLDADTLAQIAAGEDIEIEGSDITDGAN